MVTGVMRRMILRTTDVIRTSTTKIIGPRNKDLEVKRSLEQEVR